MKFYDIIEYTNEDNLLVYKHPCEDFNTNSKLIVRESQQAIFVKNGVIHAVFKAGRFNLKTENIPVLKKIKTNAISNNDKELINSVIDECMQYSTSSLIDLTRHQTPWIETYKQFGNDNVISKESIKEFFSEEEVIDL